jgi:hypothetical protein
MAYGCADFNSPPLIACPGLTTSPRIDRRVTPQLTLSWGAHWRSVYSFAMKNKKILQSENQPALKLKAKPIRLAALLWLMATWTAANRALKC